MHRRAFALFVLLSTAASGDRPSEAVPAITKEIYGNITSASTMRQEVLILLNPSLPLEWSPESTEAINRDVQSLADSLPEPQWLYVAKKESLRNLVRYIAQNAHFAHSTDALDTSDTLTDTERSLLFENGDRAKPSEAYSRFLALTQRISDAEAARRKETDPQKRAELDLERSEASLRLASLPHVEEIRAAVRKLGAHPSHRTLDNNRLLTMLAMYRGPKFAPSIDKWNDSSGWVRIESTLDGKYNAPIFAAGPSEFTTDTWFPKAMNVLYKKKPTSISFEIKRVLIDRGALDLSVLDLKSWKLDDGTLLSDGQLLSSGKRTKGRMPLVVTALLLGRNIAINVPSSAEAQDRAITASKQDTLRFGPFSIGGSYQLSSTKNRFFPALNARGIASSELQIIGLICNQQSLSPNPDSSLRW